MCLCSWRKIRSGCRKFSSVTQCKTKKEKAGVKSLCCCHCRIISPSRRRMNIPVIPATPLRAQEVWVHAPLQTSPGSSESASPWQMIPNAALCLEEDAHPPPQNHLKGSSTFSRTVQQPSLHSRHLCFPFLPLQVEAEKGAIEVNKLLKKKLILVTRISYTP